MAILANMGKKLADKAIKKTTKNMAPKATAIVSGIITALSAIITMLPLVLIASVIVVAVAAFDWVIENATAKANAQAVYSTFELKEKKDDITELIQIKKNEDGEYYLDFIDDFDKKIEEYIKKMNNQSGYHNVPEDVEFFKTIIKAEVCMKFPDLGGKIPKDSNGFQGAIDVRRVTPNKKIGEIKNTGAGEKHKVEEAEIDDPIEISPYEEIVKTWEANRNLKLINSAEVYKERESEINKGEGTGVFDVQYKKGTETKLSIDKNSIVTYTGKYKSVTNPLTKEITVYVEIKYKDIQGYIKAYNVIELNSNEDDESGTIITSQNENSSIRVADYSQVTSRAKVKKIGNQNEKYVVAIAAGHNNTDNKGASAEGLVEEELTIKVAEKVEELLKDYSNITVIQTGSTSKKPGVVKLEDRTQLAKRYNPDLCIQIHFNAGGGTGTEVIYKEGDGISQQLAKTLSNSIAHFMGLQNRGAGSDIEKCGKSLSIIENAATSGFPSVVTEGAFLDGDPDNDIIKNKDGIQKYAEGIVNGIDNYFLAEHQGYTSEHKNEANITNNVNSVIKNLKYKPLEEFDLLVNSGNADVLNYFTLDKDKKLITATWSYNNGVTTIEKNAPVDMATSLKEYIVPFEYLLFFYMDSNYKEFSEELAKKILKSEVVVAVKDNIKTTKKITETQTKTVATDSSYSTFWMPISREEIINEEVSTSVDITYIDTWFVKTYNEISYSAESLGMKNKDTVVVNIEGTVTETNSSSLSNLPTETGTATTGKKDQEGHDIKYIYTKYNRNKIDISEISNNYDSGKTMTEGKEKTFVKLYQKHEMHKKVRTNGYLFSIIENNEKTANLLNLTKYLIFKATGIDDGVVEYDFGQFKLENSGDYENTSAGSKSNLDGVPGKIADFLLAKGMPIEGVAAVLGNIEQECSFNPTCVTGNYIGIIQWGILYNGQPSRGTFLKEYATKQGKDWTDLDTQIKFMWNELNSSGYRSVKDNLMKSKDVKESAEYFARHFEKCVNGDGSLQQLDKRQNYAEKWYNQLKSKYTHGNNNSNANEIVNEALKYVGNPYVWGGSSLTNGCDCSHFVWLILRKVGAIPKNAGYLNTSGIMSSAESDWNCTKIGTDPNKAQPGDIIVYRPGNIHHTAIYIGNGKIVEAQSSNTGITSNRTLTHEAIAGIFRPKK